MKKQNIVIIGVVAFVLAVAVGYALFSEILNINGTATAQGTFDVEFTTVGQPTCNGFSKECVADNLATITPEGNNLTVSVDSLEFPGAYVTIPVTVTNVGTIPAILKSIEETGLTDDPTVKVSYEGLTELKEQQLEPEGTQNFTIKVMWDENSNNSSQNVEFTIGLNYKQITAGE